MKVLVKLENWFHMRKNGYPSRSAIESILKHLATDQRLSATLQKRIYTIAHAYAFNGETIEEIANHHVITRERVRQILLKIHYQHIRRTNEQSSVYR